MVLIGHAGWDISFNQLEVLPRHQYGFSAVILPGNQWWRRKMSGATKNPGGYLTKDIITDYHKKYQREFLLLAGILTLIL